MRSVNLIKPFIEFWLQALPMQKCSLERSCVARIVQREETERDLRGHV